MRTVRRALVLAFALTAFTPPAIAQGSSSSSSAVPKIPGDYATAPSATLQTPTNQVPHGVSPEGPSFSSLTTVVETGADAAIKGTEEVIKMGGNGKVLNATAHGAAKVLGPLNTALTVADVNSSFDRAAQCQRDGDQAGADKAVAEGGYAALGLNPVIGAAQACSDIIGNKLLGFDPLKEVIVEGTVLQFQAERALNAQGLYTVPPMFGITPIGGVTYRPPKNTGPGTDSAPGDDRARRAGKFAELRTENERSAAMRSTPAEEPSGPWSDPQMMWMMMMPGVIAASQQRPAVTPPLAPQPSPTVRCLEGQSYEYDANGRAVQCPGFQDFVRRSYGASPGSQTPAVPSASAVQSSGTGGRCRSQNLERC